MFEKLLLSGLVIFSSFYLDVSKGKKVEVKLAYVILLSFIIFILINLIGPVTARYKLLAVVLFYLAFLIFNTLSNLIPKSKINQKQFDKAKKVLRIKTWYKTVLVILYIVLQLNMIWVL